MLMNLCGINLSSVSADRAFAAVIAVMLTFSLLDLAAAQARAMPSAGEMLPVGDEPGRVSTEEVIIRDGPYARQVVYFRSSEPPGTLVIQTSERFAYLIQGNNRAL